MPARYSGGVNLPPPGTLLVLWAVSCGVGMWGVVAYRWRREENVLPAGPPTPVAHWGTAAGVAVWLSATFAAGVVPGDVMSPLVRSVIRAGLIAAGAAGVWFVAAEGFGPRRRPRRRDARDGFVTLLLALPPTAAAFLATASFRTVEGSNEMLLQLLGGEGRTWALVILSTVYFAPVGEELLFRGLLLGSLRSAGLRSAPAVIAAAGLFALLHPPQDWASLFVLACVLGWSCERTGRVVARDRRPRTIQRADARLGAAGRRDRGGVTAAA